MRNHRLAIVLALMFFAATLFADPRQNGDDSAPPTPPGSHCTDSTVPDPYDSQCFYVFHCDGTWSWYCF